MSGLVCTLLVAAVLTFLGGRAVSRFFPRLDPAEQLGLGGVLALGTSGLTILFFGLLGVVSPLVLLVPVLLCLALGGKQDWRKFKFAGGSSLNALPIVIGALVACIAVLAPSDMRDWDALAYHLAVPKLWIESGRIGFVEGIHHSNFPFTADMLYLPGLQWGGESGAKAFSLVWLLTGSLAIFGLARRWYGERAGLWASLVFVGCPVVLWESGTGYIDVAHGVFAGLAVLYFADALRGEDSRSWWLVGLSLGFAMGTKHTGLQTFGALALVGAITLFRKKDGERPAWKGLAIALGLAVLVASPWYAKSVAYTGNPVYPFFYKQLGGRDWDAWRSEIYTNEQKTFGVGASPLMLGHAVLGLAYQPGRYVNPGQGEGRGFPTGAIGFVGLAAGILWAASGRAGPREKAVLAAVGLSLLAWFLLSQQSRYLTSVLVPLAVLSGGGVRRLAFGKLLGWLAGLQFAYSLCATYMFQTADQFGVVTGAETADEYQSRRIPFYGPSRKINELRGTVKVALYDEVFGFFLDKPYMWANPGHSTLIPYERTETGRDLVAAMKGLGFTHAYVNFSVLPAEARDKWTAEMSAPQSDDPSKIRSNPDLWWRHLFAEAVRDGLLKPVDSWPPGNPRPRSVLFELSR
ncbi:MAG: glycosyltransferase family 39 protein [Armatimonadetes bacterium]|nr:glycosyltransferase family 39 protein [Armatimonadota bacterium]